MEPKLRIRSNLPRSDLWLRYQEFGGLAALQKIMQDATALDKRAIAVGPFSRIDAGEVAARDGKTRGAITNLFGSQAAYQVAVMDLALDAGSWADAAQYPAPADFATADAWVDAFFESQAARGPQHGATPEMNYASLWALWLGTVPYGLWSDRVATTSMDEYDRWAARLEAVFAEALAHFGLSLCDDITLSDLASATVSLTEGVWLNQCLSTTHPRRPNEPVAAVLLRGGRLLWRGAVLP